MNLSEQIGVLALTALVAPLAVRVALDGRRRTPTSLLLPPGRTRLVIRVVQVGLLLTLLFAAGTAVYTVSTGGTDPAHMLFDPPRDGRSRDAVSESIAGVAAAALFATGSIETTLALFWPAVSVVPPSPTTQTGARLGLVERVATVADNFGREGEWDVFRVDDDRAVCSLIDPRWQDQFWTSYQVESVLPAAELVAELRSARLKPTRLYARSRRDPRIREAQWWIGGLDDLAVTGRIAARRLYRAEGNPIVLLLGHAMRALRNVWRMRR